MTNGMRSASVIITEEKSPKHCTLVSRFWACCSSSLDRSDRARSVWDIFYKLHFRQTYVRNVVLGTVEVSRFISLFTEPFDTFEPLSRTVNTHHFSAAFISLPPSSHHLHSIQLYTLLLTLLHVLPNASPDGVYADRQSVDKWGVWRHQYVFLFRFRAINLILFPHSAPPAASPEAQEPPTTPPTLEGAIPKSSPPVADTAAEPFSPSLDSTLESPPSYESLFGPLPAFNGLPPPSPPPPYEEVIHISPPSQPDFEGAIFELLPLALEEPNNTSVGYVYTTRTEWSNVI